MSPQAVDRRVAEDMRRRSERRRRDSDAVDRVRLLLRGEPIGSVTPAEERLLISVVFQGKVKVTPARAAEALLSHPTLSAESIVRISRREGMLESTEVAGLIFSHPNSPVEARAIVVHQLNRRNPAGLRVLEGDPSVESADLYTLQRLSRLWGAAEYDEFGKVSAKALACSGPVREILDTLLADDTAFTRHRNTPEVRRKVRQMLGLADIV